MQKIVFYTSTLFITFAMCLSIFLLPQVADTQSTPNCPIGYYWNSSTNSCMVDCGPQSQSVCESLSECDWNPYGNYCYIAGSGGGSTSPCVAGAVWNPQTSSCMTDCGYYTTQMSCGSFTECQWNTSSNYCYYGTSGGGGGSGSGGGSCGTGSYWDSVTNSCMAGCESYTSSASCVSVSGCVWDSSTNHCFYPGSSGSGSGGTGSNYSSTPSAPSGLTASIVPGTKDVTLAWTDTAPNTETFKIYRRGSSGPSELIGTQAYSLRTYRDLSLALSSYEYYVVACSSSCSGQSNTAFVSLAETPKTISGTVTYMDGAPVGDAKVSAWKKDANEGKEATVGSNGSYSLAVSGGLWELYVYPTSPSANWSYSQSSKTVSFATDASSESQTISFTVTRTDTIIKGRVLKPDGSAPDASKTHINFKGSSGSWFNGNLAADGSFVIKAAAGTYDTYVDVQDSPLTAPIIPSFSVSSGETKDLGTITLTAASKTITGSVTYTDSAPVTDASVNAYQQSTGKNISGMTNSSGVYVLSVTGGAWEVSIHPISQSAAWNYGEPPRSVSFLSDTSTETMTRNFSVVKTSSAVKGRITLPDGSIPPADTVYVNIYSSQGAGFGGSVDASGQFRVAVPVGTYSVSLWSNNKTFTAPFMPNVTVAAGETKDMGTITLVATSKTITGVVGYADGQPVTDASVGAFNKATQQWRDAMVDSKGNYTIKVLGGSWEVSVHPLSQTPQWNFSQEPKIVAFKDDATQESNTLNFIVTATDAVITGKIVKSDGVAPPRDTVYVNAETSDGKNFGGGPLDASGTFRISVAAGTYKILVWSKDPALSAPPVPSVTVAQGASLDVGTIRLMAKTDHIRGMVRDIGGKGIGGIEVTAWMREGGYTSAQTDAAGSFDLLVTPGMWEVHVRLDAATAYYSVDPPQRISVTAGITTEVSFTLHVADAGVSGTVVDAAGAVLSNLYGFVNISQSFTEGHGGLGGPIERGTFSFKAPAGTYSLFAFLPPESSYTAGEPQIVILRTGETAAVKITVSKNTAFIMGVLKDEKGTTVTGVETRVFATSGKGAWQEALVDPVNGRYTLRVSAGTWYLGYDIDPKYNYISHQEPNAEVGVKEGETVSYHLVVKKAGSIISGRVTDPSGTGVFNAFVGVSKTSFSSVQESGTFKDPMIASAETGANGTYRIAVPAGSYFIKTFVSPERGFINSKESVVSIAEGETKTMDLQLRKADLAITGSVLRDGVPMSNMFVWGWSRNGGYQESFSRVDGTFRLNVTESDTWIIAAGGNIDGVFYKSNEVAVEMGTTNSAQDIHISKYGELPETVVQTAEAAKPVVVEMDGGATVVMSANATGTSGSVQIQATPDTRTPSQGEIKVIGIAYDLSARDETGQEITAFKANVTVSLPYTSEGIQAIGAREDNLVMSFWDETAGTWKTLESSVVNKEKKIVTAAVDHFTRFAIVAAADVTPPASPANLVAVPLTAGGIQLTWTNPVADFHHAKVYRSRTAAEPGAVRAVEVLTNTFTDAQDLVAGTSYFYTVRAVDAAGNESGNRGGISAVAAVSSFAQVPSTAAALPPGQVGTRRIERDLAIDTSGDDVSILQRLLLTEGVYPEGRVTGYFGSLTRQAVIRFQEKYRSEILSPNSLSAGTGFVGPATRLKINQLLGAAVVPVSSPPSRDVTAITHNLMVGSRGEDVRLLQIILLQEYVYPGGEVTGYFGPLTKAAVIRFQEKYSSEILAPAGLSRGTGFVGPATRNKINLLPRAQ